MLKGTLSKEQIVERNRRQVIKFLNTKSIQNYSEFSEEDLIYIGRDDFYEIITTVYKEAITVLGQIIDLEEKSPFFWAEYPLDDFSLFLFKRSFNYLQESSSLFNFEDFSDRQ